MSGTIHNSETSKCSQLAKSLSLVGAIREAWALQLSRWVIRDACGVIVARARP